jgi:hypothetical protein
MLHPVAAHVPGHDKSKCRENGVLDNDCCALTNGQGGQATCADGYDLTMSAIACWEGQAFIYACTPPMGALVGAGEYSIGGCIGQDPPALAIATYTNIWLHSRHCWPLLTLT